MSLKMKMIYEKMVEWHSCFFWNNVKFVRVKEINPILFLAKLTDQSRLNGLIELIKICLIKPTDQVD